MQKPSRPLSPTNAINRRKDWVQMYPHISVSAQIVLELQLLKQHNSCQLPGTCQPSNSEPPPCTHETDNLFSTIRALCKAPFAEIYTAANDYLIPGEAFFEDNPLIAATLNASTKHKYALALERFRDLTSHVDDVPLSLDHRIAIYIQDQFLQNPLAGRRQEMSNLLCMILVMYPTLKDKLGISRRCIAGWKSLTPARPAAPLTKQMVFAFAYHMLVSKQPQSATAIILSFFGCLRISEALHLCWKDVALPGDVRLSAYGSGIAGINIRDAKTSRQTGPLQFVKINDVIANGYLRVLHGDVSDHGSRVTAASYQSYSLDLKGAAKTFGFNPAIFTTHSARIGKATEDYIQGIPVDQVAINGRWKSLNSLRYYLNNGKAWILDNRVTPSHQDKLRQAEQRFIDLVDSAQVNSREQPPARTPMALRTTSN